MPERILRPGILTSDRVNKLSWHAEVFYRRLMSVVDDYGRYDGRQTILRAALFPLKLSAVSESDIGKWMLETAEAGLVSLYQVEGKPFLELVDFRQRMRAAKSKYPPPHGNDMQMTASGGHPLDNAIGVGVGVGVGVGDLTHTGDGQTPTASGPREHYLTGKSPEFQAFYAAYPRPAKIETAWEVWQAVVWKIGSERNMTDAAASEYLITKAKEFAASPAGAKPSGPDYRPLPAAWLKSGAYDDPSSEWKKPNEAGESRRSNGHAPKKPRVLPLAPKRQTKSDEIGEEMLRLMK